MSEQEKISDSFIQSSFCRLLPQLPYIFLVHSTISLHKQAMVIRHARTSFQELQVKVRLYSLADPCFQGCDVLAIQENGETKCSISGTVMEEIVSGASCYQHTFHVLGVTPGPFFVADVGVYLPTGSFIPLVRSDVLPNPWVSEEMELLESSHSEKTLEINSEINTTLKRWEKSKTATGANSNVISRPYADKPGTFIGFHPMIFPYEYEQFCGYTLYPYLMKGDDV